MKKHKKVPTDQAGFTIVELLITIVIIGIAGIGIGSLFYATQYTQVRSQHRDLATRAAQRRIEYMRNSSYNTLTAGTTQNFTADLPSGLPGAKSGVVEITEPTPGIKKLNVTVTYTENGRQRQVKMTSTVGLIGLSS